MNRGIAFFLFFAMAAIAAGCSTPNDPGITPQQPAFADASNTSNPVDSRIYADVGAVDAIDIEWKPDTSGNTSGYILYRSIDDIIGSDGLLKNRTVVAQLESNNQLIEPLPTSFKDTTGIAPGATFWYQLQAYYRSPTNNLTYSAPTHVDITTSFNYQQRAILFNPNGLDSLHGLPLKFLWEDPSDGGEFQIIVQSTDNFSYPYSALVNDFENQLTEEYPSTATPLIAGVSYRWRIKKITPNGGSSSVWVTFQVFP